MDTVKGITKQISYSRNEVCPDCKGSKTRTGGELYVCGECEGQGIKHDKACKNCEGLGRIKEPC